MFILISGIILTLAWLLFGLMMFRSLSAFRRLEAVLAEDEARVTDTALAPLPSLAVIVTACNEEADIEATVRRFAAQRYDPLEIVVVDDRSTDRTGAILDQVAADVDPTGRRVIPVHNQTLPPGWLGKCHACHLGATRTQSEWILFTDGDVTLATDDLLARVMRFVLRNGIDHLTVAPDTRPMTIPHEATMTAFGQIFIAAARIPEMERGEPRGGIGVGAFNLVRRTDYQRIGGHELLKMDTADDLKLGILLRETGSRQRLYNGTRLVRCAWQRSVVAMVRGLEKNYFGAFNYTLLPVIAMSVVLPIFALGPPLLAVAAAIAFQTGGSLPELLAGIAPLLLATLNLVVGHLLFGRPAGNRLLPTLMFPFGVMVMVVAAWNSALRILRRGGVAWRNTVYPLAELRRGLVRNGDGPRFVREHPAPPKT